MIYIVFMVLAILFYYLFGGEKIQKTESGVAYCVLMGLFLVLISGLRSETVGNDTDGYIRHFDNVKNMPFAEIKNSYEEPLFYFLCRIIGMFTDQAQIMLVVVGAITGFSFAHFIRRHSENYMLSFLMLFPFQFYCLCLSGLRQAIALSLILLAYDFIEKHRIIPCLIIFAIAYFSHHSILFALPLLFIGNKKLNRFEAVIILALIPVIYYSRRLIVGFGLQYLYTDYQIFATERTSIMTIFLYAILTVLCFISYKNAENDRYRIMKYITIGFIIQLFVSLEPNMYRIAFYYQVFSILALPMIINSITKRRSDSRVIAYLTAIIVLFVMFTAFTWTSAGINPYVFFWSQSAITN